MGSRIEYEEGQVFEGTMWTFLEELPVEGAHRMVKVVCDCGNVREKKLSNVRYDSRSCGCYKSQVTSENNRVNKTKHGLNKTREANSYRSMICRCYTKNHKDYKYYGAKGVVVCDRWLGENGLVNFVGDMGSRPENHSLDRVDPSGNYTPSNCRWANITTQNYNKRKSKKSNGLPVGVSIDENGYYKAYISYENEMIHLVYTKDLELAEFCRSEAEIHYYGYNKAN